MAGAVSPRDLVPLLPRGVRLHFDKVRDAWVLLAPERTITLDPVALAILQQIDGARPLSRIVSNLAATYDAPEPQIATDVRDYVSGLLDRRILDARP